MDSDTDKEFDNAFNKIDELYAYVYEFKDDIDELKKDISLMNLKLEKIQKALNADN